MLETASRHKRSYQSNQKDPKTLAKMRRFEKSRTGVFVRCDVFDSCLILTHAFVELT